MLEINDNKFNLKYSNANIEIKNDCNKIKIDFLTYLVVFNDRMDDIKIEIEIDNIKEKSINDLINKEFTFTFKAVAPTWEDSGGGTISFNDRKNNVIMSNLKFNGKYNYYINANIEFIWLVPDKNYSIKELEEHFDINDIETIPFITKENNSIEVKYMFIR